MNDSDFKRQAGRMTDCDLVDAIMGDPDRKENMRAALLDWMRKENPIKWAYTRDAVLIAVDSVIDCPAPTPELIAACRAMYPFRHADGTN